MVGAGEAATSLEGAGEGMVAGWEEAAGIWAGGASGEGRVVRGVTVGTVAASAAAAAVGGLAAASVSAAADAGLAEGAWGRQRAEASGLEAGAWAGVGRVEAGGWGAAVAGRAGAGQR